MLCLRRVILYGLIITVSHCLLIHAQGPGPGRRRDPGSSGGGGGNTVYSRSIDTRVQFSVKEELPPGTLVGRIPTKPGFTYRFNEHLSEFELNGTSGEIRTAKKIDRESLASDQFDLVVLSSQPTYPIDLRITVQDVNDNSPIFPSDEVEVRFSEAANPGTLVFLDPAEDLDTGVNDVTTEYKIISGNEDNHFRLVVTTNPSGEPPFLHLETTGKLDRETKAYYTLNVSAQDGGNPPRFGYLKVNIVIDDSNDNSPNFDHSDYVVSLNESVAPGTVVLQVTATDNDEGDNARISYYLAETETQFSVDPDTGVVSTTQTLNCQQNCPQTQQSCPKSCVFTVFARDHGIPRQDGRTYITVNLLDSNDHDPSLIVRYFPPTASSASVDENAQNGSVVAAISVVDMDEGPNGETVVRIVSGNELGHFRLESTPSFQLVRVNGVLDREKISKYNLTIVATDKGTPPRSSTTFLIIRINDVNDHNPNFLKTEYSAVLRELVPVGTYVSSITATDEDTGINSQVYYSIVSGNERMWFHIDPNSGLLTTRAPLDREQQGTIRLKISARDGGPNPKWAHAQIKITILDDNDEKPQLVDENLTATLSEEVPPGSLIATITASDHDQGTNGTVSYYLSPDTEDTYPGAFHVDPTTGRLVSRLHFDRETLSSYHIQVIAKDQGVPALSSTATVQLTVSDVNDNDPQIYPSEYYVIIDKDTPPNTTILNVTAYDPDEGLNSHITFTLESSAADYFTIDRTTGSIVLKRGLKSTSQTKFVLTVSARDGGNRNARQQALVEILIRSSDMQSIRFKQPVYNFTVTEDAFNKMNHDGKEVGKVEAMVTRRDGGQVKYSITDGDPDRIFMIEESTGVIRSVKVLDRESKADYNLTVYARQATGYGHTTVLIYLQDVNDNAPRMEKKRVIAELQENAPIGCEVYLVKVVDPDTGENSRITFALTQNPDNMFLIDPTNGLISLNKPLRFSSELTKTTIEVSAKDNGSPALSSRMSITVKIIDYNDHSPIFDHSSYETSLLETTAVNTRFFALQATDEDVGENADISYEIVDGNGAKKFGVFPDGYLYVKAPLDREEQDYFSLTVMAKDNGTPQRSSTVSVVIFLIDENDNAPEFTNSTFTFFIAENEPPDTYVGKVWATDKDVGRNAELTYSIHSVQSDFVIDLKNGFVKSLKSFDRENLLQTTGQDFIALEIIVQDGGSVSLTDKAQMVIYITDVNDNQPNFLRNSYSAQISEAAPLGSQIVRVIASDIDEGLNGDIFYYLSQGNEDNFFKIDTTTGQITLAKHLDRESQAQHILTVVAQDTAEVNPLSSSTSVKIDVLDENDNCPEFVTPSDFRITIIETTPVNTELIKFHASDPDVGLNQQVSLYITGGNRHETFRIDPKTGSLYLNKPLDFERYSSYVLNITASDAGNPRLSSSIQFTVTVQDYNDNAPVFPSTAIVRQIQEGIAVNSPIVTVSAEDPDSGLNGKVKYSIISQDPEGNHFGIDPNLGVIHTLKPIDREFADTFRITVLATDQALPTSARLSAEKLVTVIVEDVNDNSPSFYSMNAALLRQNSGKDTEIIRVGARDPDSESNGEVTYEMISGDSGLFRLDRNTGSLVLKRSVGDVQPRYHLTVRATDEAIQSQRKSSDLYLSVLGVSEKGNSGSSPILTFPPGQFKGSVLENEPVGTSILTVTASYSDKSFSASGNNNHHPEIEYYLTKITSVSEGKMQDRLFDIDLKRGTISTAAVLDREMGVWKFQLEVYAILVSTTGLHTSSAKVEIDVLDRNDSPPSFQSKLMSLNVSESAPVGQEITKVVATDKDTFGTLSYSIVKGDDGKFSIDPPTGILKVSEALDRETKEEYRLVVRASDGIQHSDAVIVVHVTDSNDNSPEFSLPAYPFDIPEDALPGYRVGALHAVDPDKDANGQVTYSVLSDWGNDVFSLNPQTGVFTLTSRLDYEEVQHYIFVIQAQDTGHPSLSSTTTVYFNVIDLNDNTPIFDPMSYNREVYENVSVGSSIVTVSATDLDSGLNGKITYSIVSGNDNGAFEIMENGTILTTTKLDRETKPYYALVVQASDLGPLKQLSSTVQVSIVLKDVNDEAPMFASPNVTYVTENSPVNTVLLAVKAIDKDEGRNSYVEYILNNEKSTFTLGPVDGLLRVIGPIDREMTQNYTLKITAKDRGEPSKSTQQELIVRVMDANDNSPVFDPRQYSAAIPENSSIGMSVLQVSATDMDEGLNSQIRYLIMSGDPNRDFSIGEDSGVLRLAKSLNYERKRTYTLTIQAEDSGEQVRYDTATVTIHVLDINDNPPNFLDSPYLAFVRENMMTLPTAVLTVKAYDADSAANNHQVRYLMKDGDKGSFRVNTTSGEITVHRTLDRERQSEYMLTVVAMDTGTPRLTGTGVVRVVVQDVNDNNPVMEHERYEFVLEENVPIGTRVGQVVATDLDDGLNALIRYCVVAEAGVILPFDIKKETGEIVTTGEVDREAQEIYHVIMEASDSNPVEPRSTRANVTIRIYDLNDNAPKFERTHYTVNIPDNIAGGGYVLGVSATDLDTGLNSRIRYYLDGEDADKFQISEKTGVIKSLRALQASGAKQFNLNIHATDSSRTKPLSSVCHVQVSLISASKFPKIKPGQRAFTFPENANNAVVTTVQPLSSNQSSSIISSTADYYRFYIGGGNIGNAFQIDPSTGVLRISSGGLDYETATNYELWVEMGTVEDPSLRTAVAFFVNVTDYNDNSPEFEHTVYNFSVPEEEPGPRMVATVHANDIDSGLNGKVRYQLGSESRKLYDRIFAVRPETGEIFTKTKLDREEVSQFILTVEAEDFGTPPLTGSATVVVNVEDKNDNPPRFTRLFSVNVTENVPIGTFVIQVTSVDKDIGANANCTYSFTENAYGKFKIDPLSGNVTVSGLLDRETQDEYLLKVAAIDGSWRAETLVTVTIQDVNDNAPMFEYSYYNFNIPEGDHPVVFVGQVTASDRDKRGPNSLVSYGLKQPSDYFSVDPVSGEIFSKKPLKYKPSSKRFSPENEYSLVVTATDSGKPPMSSECAITINVVDGNNSRPRFLRPSYFSPVLEDSPVGHRIVQVTAKDPDLYGINAELEYLKIGGNGSELFNVEKSTGWITVAESLIGRKPHRYVLHLRVVDKGIPPQSDDVQVALVVSGPNKHAPVFSALSYRVIVPENEALGSIIVTVTATDQDAGPNGQIFYNITSGNEQNKFVIDSTSGAVSINQDLDYDTKKEYHLNISATDMGYHSKSSKAQLTVILTDINDNPPTFNSSLFVAHLKENSPFNSDVIRLKADDKDSPKNAVIRYSIVGGSGKNSFTIDPALGIIRSSKVFNYEEKREYTLEILAANPDSNLFGTTQVQVMIDGVNEFYPKFVQAVFQFTVSESAPIGSQIGSVQATDEDVGEDGNIYYLFVGSSNDRGFSISPTTGVISVTRRLDRESQSRVVLTVLAKNGGSIVGNDTDEAQVVILVQDGNDPPVFEKELYQAEVSEGAPVGTTVLTVKASDVDVRPSNNRFSYEIINGNDNNTFKIDPISGVILTASALDREEVPRYHLIVGAIDTGQPPQTGTTTVKISLLDINDNGPKIEKSSLEGSIYENEPPNTKVMTLRAVDADLSPNGEPFTYILVGGPDASKFKVDRRSGVVTSLVPFDREATPELKIIVEVHDRGTPPMKSRQEIKITVTDKNDSPSQPRNAQLMLYTFMDKLPVDKVATVVPLDPDATGQYTCRLEKSEQVFNIPINCDLYLNRIPNYKRQSLKILSDDGRHAEVTSTIAVEFLSFDNQTLQNSVVIRILSLTPRTFLEKSYSKLLAFFRQILRHEPHIYSLSGSSNGTDIVLAAWSGSSYSKPDDVTSTLLLHTGHLESLLDAKVIINYSPCSTQHVCQNGASCSQSLRVHMEPSVSESSLLIISSPTVKLEMSCKCHPGFVGESCELRREPCQPNPCEGAGSICTKQGFDFQCTCPPHLHGKRCELERSSACESNPCKNGGSCQENVQTGSYFCLCRPGFFGNQCQAASDACRPNPCLNGGECISNPGSPATYPRCKCPTHYYGRHCEKSAFGFSFGSFMAFPPLDPNTNDVSIIFSTNKKNALLVYNFGEQTGGRSDFVAIQLINGIPTFSYGGSRTAISVVRVNKFVADGNWHRVIATRNSRVLSLSVSDCKESGEVCSDCRPGDSSCYANDVGPTGTLSFNGNSLLLGGLQSVDPILQRPDQIHTDDFVGCIHSVVVNGRQLNLSASMDSRGISATCQRVHDICEASGNKCGSGKCIDLWDSHTCQCPNGVRAPNCAEAFQPFTFSVGSFVEYKVGEKYRRSQLLQGSVFGSQLRRKREIRSKSISFNFRTIHNEAVLLYSASDKDYTVIELENGELKFSSKVGSNYPVSMGFSKAVVVDGLWHSMKLSVRDQVVQVFVDGERQGEELDASSVHDFLDPYLTAFLIGGVKDENVQLNKVLTGFVGCISNFTINDELQPLNGSGGIFDEVIHYGKIGRGCSSAIAGAATAPDPLSIGVTLVIVFFVILLVAILVSFVVFRLRKREKSPLPPVTPTTKQSPAQQTPSDVVRNHVLEGEAEAIRNLVRNSKKIGDPNSGYQKPDIIERTTSTPTHNQASSSPPGSAAMMNASSNNGISMDPEVAEMPEHYDLENASSIAPSDIDIVYHYKGFRDNLGGRSNKSSPFRHNHHFPGSRQSPGIRQSPISNVLKSTPLARLSPSSELSQQTTPRILTLKDISGKPLQSALLATTQKDAMSQSERSLNISHSSSRSSIINASSQGTKKKRKKCAGDSGSSTTIGLTAEEIERLNNSRHKNNSSLVSTLDAVSSSESDDRRKNKLADLLEANTEIMQRARDTSSDEDESGNDSFTCSEFEYDDEKRNYRPPHHRGMFSKLSEVPNEGAEDSFRGSISTLVASDDDLGYINSYSKSSNPNGGPNSSVGWDYLLNWGPNFGNIANVFKDMAELPDGAPSNSAMTSPPVVSGLNNLGSAPVRSSRYPTPRPSEEYV